MAFLKFRNAILLNKKTNHPQAVRHINRADDED